MTVEGPEGGARGPICPRCRQPLRETLRSEELVASTPEGAADRATEITFCGACGCTLMALPAPRPVGAVHWPPEVADPVDGTTLGGQFQLRCRELVSEVVAAGFTPGGWIQLINTMGAVGAAKHLLSSGRILPVTPWLVERGRRELTMEHEITEPRWEGLFTDDERAQAARRLASPGGPALQPF